jgi:hypothetical protein
LILTKRKTAIISLRVLQTDFVLQMCILPDFQRSSSSGTRSIQPHEYNWGATLKNK